MSDHVIRPKPDRSLRRPGVSRRPRKSFVSDWEIANLDPLVYLTPPPWLSSGPMDPPQVVDAIASRRVAAVAGAPALPCTNAQAPLAHTVPEQSVGSDKADGAPEKRRLLDTVRDAVRTRHYSPRTEKAYVGWIRRFVFFHAKRHPRDMGEIEVRAFLSNLATAHKVSASTQNQAFSALLFLYREVLERPLSA